jgi:hypothetical protein
MRADTHRLEWMLREASMASAEKLARSFWRGMDC